MKKFYVRICEDLLVKIAGYLIGKDIVISEYYADKLETIQPSGSDMEVIDDHGHPARDLAQIRAKDRYWSIV